MTDAERIAALEERVATLERRMGSVDIIAETLPVSEGADDGWECAYTDERGETLHTYSVDEGTGAKPHIQWVPDAPTTNNAHLA